jgi:putative peptide maturation dehydrogenase
MRYVRRSRYGFVRFLDDGRAVAVAVLDGNEELLDDPTLAVFRAIPADRWVRVEEAGPMGAVQWLVERGLVVADDPGPRLVELRQRDEALATPAWNRYAALFEAMTRWSGVHHTTTSIAGLKGSGMWPPPPHFHHAPAALRSMELPLVEGRGALFDALRTRKTWRGFDSETALTLEQLSLLLRYTWGAHGIDEVVPGQLAVVKRTSPSGGAQHPGEVYPLLSCVEGVEPGLYHYDVEHHALELLEPLTAKEARSTAYELAADQEPCLLAPATFLLTARFDRKNWKYPGHNKAFRSVLLDAGHLSQTFHLLCAAMRLGSFITGCINDADVATRLGLRQFCEGALLMLSCGRPVPRNEQAFVPFVPARSGPEGPQAT